MKNQISNVKKEIFATKEHYLHFRQSWKDFINAGKAKPYYEDPGYGGGRKKYSNLRGSHHLLFCILTEKDISVTFKPSECEDKRGFWDAKNEIMMMFIQAKNIVEGKRPDYLTPQKYGVIMKESRAKMEEFLEPFGKSFTTEMFVRLIKDHVKPAKLTNIPLRKFDEAEAA